MQLGAVGVEVGDRGPGKSLVNRSLGHSGSNRPKDSRIERLGDEVLGPEGKPIHVIGTQHRIRDGFSGEVGQTPGGGDFHPLRNTPGPHVESAPKNGGEAENIVDLIRIVASTGGHDDIISGCLGIGVRDFGIGVGEGEHNGPVSHGPNHFLGDYPGDRNAHEGVCAHHGIAESPGSSLHRELAFDVVEVVPPIVDHTPGVGHDDAGWIHTEFDEETGSSHTCCSGSGEHDARFGNVAAGQLECVEEGSPADDGRAVLVVMEYRDVETLTEGLLDVEALRCLDVFEVDSTDRGGEQFTETDHVFGVGGIDLEVKDIDIGKPFEEHRFSLHHRLAGQRTDVSQA